MSTLCTGVSLISTILTPEILDTITEERPMGFAARLLIALMEKTTSAFLKKKMEFFDANPGDGACQVQALKLYRLVQSEVLKDEAEAIAKLSQRLKVDVQQRVATKKKQPEPPPKEFFLKTFERHTISEDMRYLFEAFLLKHTRVRHSTQNNGIVITKTEPERVANLVKNIYRQFHLPRYVSEIASRLSEHSAQFIREVAPIGSLAETMLSQARVRKKAINKKFPPKSFACFFFQVVAFLATVKEDSAIICLKSIVTEGTPSFFYFQATKTEFIPLEAPPEAGTPMIVFEGVIRDESSFVEEIGSVGFEEMVLTLAAQEAPYGPGSTLDDIGHPQALETIQGYRDKAQKYGLEGKINSFFLIDHVFCKLMEPQ